MRTKLLVLILLGLLIVTTGCIEPYGGGAGYQYLGRVDSVRYVYVCLDSQYVTYIQVAQDTFKVAGRVELKKLYQAHVWVNARDSILRLRTPGRDITAEYPILSRTKITVE